jgi:hypothetical protein
MKLETHAVTPVTGYDLSGLTKLAAEGELAGLITAGRSYTPAASRAQGREVMSGADAAFARKRYLDSMLAYMEYYLMTGENTLLALKEKRETLALDADVAGMLGSISPHSREQADQAAPILVELRKKSPTRKHVLMIFEANVRLTLEQPAESKKNFLAALAVNPYIVGAWKDLGDLYFKNYEMREAWRCWDLARQLLPGHPMLQPVGELEQNLLTTYPEFF